MELLKKIAEKILKKELDELRADHDYYKKRWCHSESLINDSLKVINSQREKILKYQKENEDLVKKNAIMLEYYKADEEPSDSIKLSILTNLRIHDLEQELLTERLLRVNSYNHLNNMDYYRFSNNGWVMFSGKPKQLGDCPCERCEDYISRSDAYRIVEEWQEAKKEEEKDGYQV